MRMRDLNLHEVVRGLVAVPASVAGWLDSAVSGATPLDRAELRSDVWVRNGYKIGLRVSATEALYPFASCRFEPPHRRVSVSTHDLDQALLCQDVDKPLRESPVVNPDLMREPCR
jgi:hypothetical protein